MANSIFGWSYPPGCHSVPGDEPTPPCALCGKDPEQDPSKGGCDCGECPECGEHGCLEHLSLSYLIRKMEIISHQKYELDVEFKRRQQVGMIHCPGCQKELLPDLVDGLPYWCPDCKKNYDKDGKEVVEWV